MSELPAGQRRILHRQRGIVPQIAKALNAPRGLALLRVLDRDVTRYLKDPGVFGDVLEDFARIAEYLGKEAPGAAHVLAPPYFRALTAYASLVAIDAPADVREMARDEMAKAQGVRDPVPTNEEFAALGFGPFRGRQPGRVLARSRVDLMRQMENAAAELLSVRLPLTKQNVAGILGIEERGLHRALADYGIDWVAFRRQQKGGKAV